MDSIQKSCKWDTFSDILARRTANNALYEGYNVGWNVDNAWNTRQYVCRTKFNHFINFASGGALPGLGVGVRRCGSALFEHGVVAMVDHCSAALVCNSCGSPGHCDTIQGVIKHCPEQIIGCVAFGYVFSGDKLWNCQNTSSASEWKKVVDAYNTFTAIHKPQHIQDYIATVQSGKQPRPFQGKFSFGDISLGEFSRFPQHGLNNHVHIMRTGDSYIVNRSRFHMVRNWPLRWNDITEVFAYDDILLDYGCKPILGNSKVADVIVD